MHRFAKRSLWVAGFIVLIMLIMWLPDAKDDSVVSRWSLPLSGKTIVIDPGHGSPDGGAEAMEGETKIYEKDITLPVATKLKNYLQQAGAFVYLTREDDDDLAKPDTEGFSRRKAEDIRKRLGLINGQDADFFVSIHLNALPSSKWHGAQTFYYPESEKGEHLAKMIQSEMKHQLENTNRKALGLERMYLLQNADIPGALLEVGFLSNEQERKLLQTDDYQDKVAASIYHGVLRYVTEEPDKSE